MRLWSLHPRYLDTPGLVALWREALLAQAVLRGRTRGYRHHPQLQRFRGSGAPVGAVTLYLRAVHDEARHRGFAFDRRRIARSSWVGDIPVRRGQLRYEWEHLKKKIAMRAPDSLVRLDVGTRIEPHPLFRVVRGEVEAWEVGYGS